MRYLFVVAHPDDEILGGLGTINSLIRQGHSVAVQIMSTRSATREDSAELKKITKEVHKEIGINGTYFSDYHMVRFGQSDRMAMTRDIEDVIRREEPDFIFTHDKCDIHHDHRVLAEVVLEASKLYMRGTGYNHVISGIYGMEILTSTEWGDGFIPNAYFEISEKDISKKEELLKRYMGVVRDLPHPRNYETFKALARFRGAQCGLIYAEAHRKISEVNCDRDR